MCQMLNACVVCARVPFSLGALWITKHKKFLRVDNRD